MPSLAQAVAERVMAHINDAGDRLATCLTRGSTRQGLTITRADASQIGFDDGFIYSEVARVPELRKIPHLRLMTDNAQMAFTKWACSPGKIRY